MTDYYYQDYQSQLYGAEAALRQARRELGRSLNANGQGDANDPRLTKLEWLEEAVHEMVVVA